MSDHDADDEVHADDGHAHEESFDRHEEHGDDGRVTSPMQDFESSQVTTGFVVLVVGLVVVFGLPLLL